MSAENGCDEIQGLLPELALGVAEGDERASALEHLADCPACARRLAELSGAADSLLLLAPREEPPAGFETGVLAEFQPRRRRSRLGGAWLRTATAAAASAALAATAVLVFAYQGDRDLAGRYRDTLDEANGRYLDANRLEGPGGEEVGTAFGYEGSPSWVLVTVDASAPVPSGQYAVEAITTDGSRLHLGRLRVGADGGSVGRAIPIDFGQVDGVRLLGPGRHQVYDADFYGTG